MELLTDEVVAHWKSEIDGMSQEELARLQRFAPPGHPVFRSDGPLYVYFQARFGGMTPQISKKIGWGD